MADCRLLNTQALLANDKANQLASVTEVAFSFVRPGFVGGMSGAYRNIALRNLSPFFAWCVKRGLSAENPCVLVSRAKVVQSAPQVLSVEEAESVMRVASSCANANIASYFAIALFAGVRPDEIRRLRKDDFRNGHIILSAAITKTADARTVRIRQNLEQWLHAFPPENLASVTPTVLHRFRTKVSVNWSSDCCRHSFAIYAYEQSHDAVSVASEMGHAGTAVFFRHYRALASPGDGDRFFSITP